MKVYLGDEGLKELAMLKDYNNTPYCCKWSNRNRSTVEGIKKSKRIALANKETMVKLGGVYKSSFTEHPKSEIIP